VKTIVIACEKGGVGKSTLAINLALAFGQTAQVGLVEADTQKSIQGWQARRGNDDVPILAVDPREAAQAVAAAKLDKFDYLIFDTAPTRHLNEIKPIFEHADLVIVPVPPVMMDLEPSLNTVIMAKNMGKKCCVVLTKVPPQRGVAKHWRIVEAQKNLSDLIDISPVTVGDREAFKAANDQGKSVIEIDKSGKAALEIGQLAHWIYGVMTK